MPPSTGCVAGCSGQPEQSISVFGKEKESPTGLFHDQETRLQEHVFGENTHVLNFETALGYVW